MLDLCSPLTDTAFQFWLLKINTETYVASSCIAHTVSGTWPISRDLFNHVIFDRRKCFFSFQIFNLTNGSLQSRKSYFMKSMIISNKEILKREFWIFLQSLISKQQCTKWPMEMTITKHFDMQASILQLIHYSWLKKACLIAHFNCL